MPTEDDGASTNLLWCLIAASVFALVAHRTVSISFRLLLTTSIFLLVFQIQCFRKLRWVSCGVLRAVFVGCVDGVCVTQALEHCAGGAPF